MYACLEIIEKHLLLGEDKNTVLLHISFTTDAQSSSLLSLTAHWLTEQSVTSHAIEYLTQVYKKMLPEWEPCGAVANMVEAMREHHYLHCFAYTLH